MVILGACGTEILHEQFFHHQDMLRLELGAIYLISPGVYRVTRHLDSYILLQSIWGVPPVCGPLLQLASQGNFPN